MLPTIAESVLTFTVISGYGLLLNHNHKNTLQGIVKVCCKLAGAALNDPSPAFYKWRVLRKAGSVVADPRRPLEEGV